MNRDEILIPQELAIETIFGCNLKCTMCSIDAPTDRKKGAMSMDLFRYIADEMVPYRSQIERVDLFGLGEPLLDPHIFERIRYLRERSFRNLGLSTNANLLDLEKRKALLETGIETVIFSIDGFRKETHEKIRRGSSFERVVSNVEETIKMRDRGNYGTRFVIRLIRQPGNESEWAPYREFWNQRLSREKRDYVVAYDMHNNGGLLVSKEEILAGTGLDPAVEARPCHFLFECLIILADGQIAACHPDFHEPHFHLGKIPPMTPIEAFNSPSFRHLREMHRQGRKVEFPLCRECNIPYCEVSRELGWEVVERTATP